MLLTGRFFPGVQAGSTAGKNLPSSRGGRAAPHEARAGPAAPGRPARDLTAPVKIYLQVVVQIHRNEHEFLLMIPCGRRPAARARAAPGHPPHSLRACWHCVACQCTLHFSYSVARVCASWRDGRSRGWCFQVFSAIVRHIVLWSYRHCCNAACTGSRGNRFGASAGSVTHMASTPGDLSDRVQHRHHQVRLASS